MTDKLKDSIITEEEIDTKSEEGPPEVIERAWYPAVKKKVYIDHQNPTLNSQLCNIEQVLNASLAILLARKESGELSTQDWKRLGDIVEMRLKIAKLENVSKKTSMLEDKTDQEIIEMVELAKTVLGDDDEDM